MAYIFRGPSWAWSYGNWVYNYVGNQYISPLTLWLRIALRRGLIKTKLYDKVCQWLAAGRWFSPGTPVSCTDKTDHHDMTEILWCKPSTNQPIHHKSILCMIYNVEYVCNVCLKLPYTIQSVNCFFIEYYFLFDVQWALFQLFS